MIFENVRDALAQQFEVEPESITMDTNLIDDLGADSLDILQLLMRIEDQYGIVIPDQALATFEKVRILDLPYKFRNTLLPGQRFIDAHIPDIHQSFHIRLT